MAHLVFQRFAALRADGPADGDVAVVDGADARDDPGGLVAAEPEALEVQQPGAQQQWAALALAVAPDQAEAKRKRTEKAREALAAKRAKAKADEALLASYGGSAARKSGLMSLKVQQELVALGDRGLDVATGKFIMSEGKAAALTCLAMMPKIRGTRSHAAERMQRRALCLVADAIIARQQGGLELHLQESQGMVREGGNGQSSVLALNFMFDEAQQRMKTMVNKVKQLSPATQVRVTNMPVSSSVMVCLCKLMFEAWSNGQPRKSAWEPWVCPLQFLTKGTADCLVEGFLRVFPFRLDSQSGLSALGNSHSFAFLAVGMDSAAANLSAMTWVMDVVMNDGKESIALHIEPCASHQTHIVKTRAIDIAGLAATMYSSSKLLRLNTSMNGVRDGIFEIMGRTLDVFHQVGPASEAETELFRVAQLVFGLDQDLSFLWKRKGGRLVPTPFLVDIQELCRRLSFNRETGR